MKNSLIIGAVCICLHAVVVEGGAGEKNPKQHTHKQHHRVAAKPILDTTYYCGRLGIDTCDGEGAAVAQRSLVREINQWSGVRYRRAGETSRGIDCSGFVMKVFQNALSISLPRTSRMQCSVGNKVDDNVDLRFGDLVFFQSRRHRINHVGIYVGDGIFVHAHRHGGVGVGTLSDEYYSKRFVGARRIPSFGQNYTYEN